MTIEREKTADPLNQTEVRFSIRSMLVAMAVLASLITALGAFVRRFPSDARPRLAVYWSVLAVLLLAMFVYAARKRYRSETQAGRVLFRLVPHSYILPRAPGWARTLMGILCLAFAPAIWVVHSFGLANSKVSPWSGATDVNVIYSLMAAAAGISFLWWRRIIVAENGLIIRNNFVPWSGCRSWYWDACNRDVAVLRTTIQAVTAMKVPEKDRGAIEALFREKCANKGSVPGAT